MSPHILSQHPGRSMESPLWSCVQWEWQGFKYPKGRWSVGPWAHHGWPVLLWKVKKSQFASFFWLVEMPSCLLAESSHMASIFQWGQEKSFLRKQYQVFPDIWATGRSIQQLQLNHYRFHPLMAKLGKRDKARDCRLLLQEDFRPLVDRAPGVAHESPPYLNSQPFCIDEKAITLGDSAGYFTLNLLPLTSLGQNFGHPNSRLHTFLPQT